MINNVINSTPVNTLATEALTGASKLGQEQFLELLVAQLQNQDPLNPMDSTAFTAQLAEFSSLEQLIGINEGVVRMAEATLNNQDLQQLEAFSLIGRRIEVPGPGFHYEGTPVEFGYSLDTPADEIIVQILDAQGQVVAVMPEAEGQAGVHYYTWDGTGVNGVALPPGDYQVKVERVDGESTTAISSRVIGLVTGVDLGDMECLLMTNAGSFTLEDVLSVTGA